MSMSLLEALKAMNDLAADAKEYLEAALADQIRLRKTKKALRQVIATRHIGTIDGLEMSVIPTAVLLAVIDDLEIDFDTSRYWNADGSINTPQLPRSSVNSKKTRLEA